MAMAADDAELVSIGRACVFMIEAADVLLRDSVDTSQEAVIRAARRICVERLRRLVAMLPPERVAEIMAASQKIQGTIQDIGRN